MPRTNSVVPPDALHAGLFAWIWRNSRREQLALLLLILASLPFYFFALDLPKQIVNGPIQGAGFASPDATRPFLALGTWFPAGSSLRDSRMLQGFSLDRGQMLAWLSVTFLLLVIINGAFKLWINTAKGRLGEEMLKRLRLELFERVLRFPPRHVRRVKGGEIASIIKDEVEPLGGFIGDAYAVPLFLAGQALTASIFILLQSVWLGLVALSVVALQAYLMPMLRRPLLELSRERQLAARSLAGRVTEVVDGLADVQANEAAARERDEMQGRLAGIFRNRYAIYRRKFTVKFINNALAQVPPLVFFALGGWLTLKGLLDIGQLVAVIVAYKELPGPIKELIDWDQQRQDAQQQFEQIVAGFPIETAPGAERGTPPDWSGTITPLTVSGLTVADDDANERLTGVDLAIGEGERIAAAGLPGAGASLMADVLAGRIEIEHAALRLGRDGVRAKSLPRRAIAFAGETPHIPDGSLRNALLYGWQPVTHSDAETAERDRRLDDALRVVRLEDEVLELALASRIPPATHTDLVGAAVSLRPIIAAALARDGHDHLFAPFDEHGYNPHMSIADNLVMGRIDPAFSIANVILTDAVAQEHLREHGIEARLHVIGQRMIEVAIELYGDLDPDHPMRLAQRLVPPDLLASYQHLARALDGTSADGSADDAQRDMAALRLAAALAYIEPVHRLGLLDAAAGDAIVAARAALRAHLAATASGAITLLDQSIYAENLTLEQNLLFGAPDTQAADGERRLRQTIRSVLAGESMIRTVLAVGLDMETGANGRRLSLAQRQRVGLARALIRSPELLIVDRALSASGPARQKEITAAVLRRSTRSGDQPRPAVYWVTGESVPDPELFDRVVHFADGRVVADRVTSDAPEAVRTPAVGQSQTGGVRP